MTEQPKRLLLDKPSAAEVLGISARVLDRLVVDGEIEVVRIGRRVFVPYAAAEEYVERLRSAS